MQVGFGDERLRRLAVDAAFHLDGWTPMEVRRYRMRLQTLLAARGRAELAALLSLELSGENGPSGSRCSIHVMDRLRLVLEFDVEKTDEVTVVGILVSEPQEVTP